MSTLTQAAGVGLGVSAPSRAAPCATFSFAPRQELGTARAAASWGPDSGRGVPGPRAPRCPLLPTAPRPSLCSALRSPGLWPPRAYYSVLAAASRCRLSSRRAMAPGRCAPAPAPAQPRPAPPPRPAVSFSVAVPPTPVCRRPLRLGPGPRRVPGSPGSPSSRRPRRAENSQLAARAPLRRLSPLLTRDPRPAAEAARPGCQPRADPAPTLPVRLTHAGKPLAHRTRDSGKGRGAAPSDSRADPARVFLLAPPRSSRRIRSEDPLPGLRGPGGQVGRVLRAQRRVGGNRSIGVPVALTLFWAVCILSQSDSSQGS